MTFSPEPGYILLGMGLVVGILSWYHERTQIPPRQKIAQPLVPVAPTQTPSLPVPADQFNGTFPDRLELAVLPKEVAEEQGFQIYKLYAYAGSKVETTNRVAKQGETPAPSIPPPPPLEPQTTVESV